MSDDLVRKRLNYMKAEDFDKKFDEGKEDIIDDLDLSRGSVSTKSKNVSMSISRSGWSSL